MECDYKIILMKLGMLEVLVKQHFMCFLMPIFSLRFPTQKITPEQIIDG